MLRFFLGFGFGVILTLCSFGFIGVGHGTYVPMAFTGSLIALITVFGAIPVIIVVPFLWALYFLLVPRIRSRAARITSAVMILLGHVLSGVLLAIEDPAFWRILSGRLSVSLGFGLLLALAMTSLLYFAVRGSNRANAVKPAL